MIPKESWCSYTPRVPATDNVSTTRNPIPDKLERFTGKVWMRLV